METLPGFPCQDCRQLDVGLIALKALWGGPLTNIPAAVAFFNQFDNVVPIWGIQYMPHEATPDGTAGLGGTGGRVAGSGGSLGHSGNADGAAGAKDSLLRDSGTAGTTGSGGSRAPDAASATGGSAGPNAGAGTGGSDGAAPWDRPVGSGTGGAGGRTGNGGSGGTTTTSSVFRDPGDSGACSCGGMTIDCFCSVRSCVRELSAFTSGKTSYATLIEYAGCNLTVVTTCSSAGINLSVYDRSTGALVGRKYHSDTIETCPFTGTSKGSRVILGGLEPATNCKQTSCTEGSQPVSAPCPRG